MGRRKLAMVQKGNSNSSTIARSANRPRAQLSLSLFRFLPKPPSSSKTSGHSTRLYFPRVARDRGGEQQSRFQGFQANFEPEFGGGGGGAWNTPRLKHLMQVRKVPSVGRTSDVKERSWRFEGLKARLLAIHSVGAAN